MKLQRRQTNPVTNLSLFEAPKQTESLFSAEEQLVWDLEHRGIADIDIPVLILGITA